MAFRGFIAGPYLWTFNSRLFGITEDGWRLNMTNYGDPVKGDNLGDSVQDYVYRGGDVTIEGVLQEWDVALNGLTGDVAAKVNLYTQSIFWPWSNLGTSGKVGQMASFMAAPLIGIPQPLSSADRATAGFRNITVTYAVLAPGYNTSMLFASRLRNVPIRLQALPAPIVDSGSETWFTLS